MADRTVPLDAGYDGILVFDHSNRVLTVNQRFLDLFDLAPEQVTAQSGEQVQALLQPRRDLGACGSDVDLFQTVGGAIVERYSLQGADDPAGGHTDIYRDVTAWRDRLYAAADEQALLHTAQEIAHVGSWTWEAGPERPSLHCSAEAARIFGVRAKDFPATPESFLALVVPDDREAVRRVSDAAFAGGDVHEVEFRIVRQARDLRWLHMKAHVMRREHGSAHRMVGTVQDITGRRLLEEQLRQSQKLQAIGRLAGGVAHDLNNALTAIVGYTELTLGALVDTHPALPDVLEIRRAAERAEAVTRQLLAFSRKQPLEPRTFHLSRTIESLSRMLQRLLGTQIRMETVVEPGLPPIYGDPGQIQQALINLALNARDAMKEGGRLVIRARRTMLDDAEAGARTPLRPGEYVELSVSDNGVGMSVETQAHIFEPFFTTKEVGQGTGLGLPMVYGTMQQSGGSILVESSLGVGTVVRLYFPPAEMPAPVAERPAAVATAKSGPATILVAEDETAVRMLVVTALSPDGYRVLQAESGASALRIAAEHLHAIDLLLTDANMPGMNGIELANELVRRRGSLHVVIMSGYTTEALSVTGLEQPLVLLPKPFTPTDLRHKIREVLARG